MESNFSLNMIFSTLVLIVVVVVVWIIWNKIKNRKVILKENDLEVNENIKKPIWFITLLILSAMPILLFPFMVFVALFIGAQFSNEILQTLVFYGIMSYPLFLIANIIFCNKNFHKHKVLSIILAATPVLLFIVFFLFLFIKK